MLHAVHITCFGKPNPSTQEFIEHPNGFLQSIALRAPNIKHIAMQINATWGYLSGLKEIIQAKSGAKSIRPTGLTELKTLSWPLNSKITVEQFQDWQTITDFGLLKSWTVGFIEDSTLLRTIENLNPFQQLTRLTLALFHAMDDLSFWDAAGSMFKSLPPFSHLCLLGTYSPKFLNGSALCRHGPTLRELRLQKGSREWASQDLKLLSQKGQVGPIFSIEDILKLAGQCPFLQKLLICVQRYQGLETDMRTSLGRFPCLEELDLVLNCLPQMGPNNTPVSSRELSDSDKSLINNACPHWFIEGCMINCAISENLAKAFFLHIGECQDMKHLVQLVIHPLLGQCNQYSCHAFEALGAMDKRFLEDLALIWTVKQGFLTGLHATSEKWASH
ncbi:hypothetical protein N7507_003118 [Penicillium longicatenatum]|nr:hypothetical protein N7507_003118 [Penicillium longicatenatum]